MDYYQREELSNSEIKKALSCPEAYYSKRMGFYTEPEEENENFVYGHFIHISLLEPHLFRSWLKDNIKWFGKEPTLDDYKAELEKAGIVFKKSISKKDIVTLAQENNIEPKWQYNSTYYKLQKCVSKAQSDKTFMLMLENTHRELEAFKTINGVECKGKADAINYEHNYIFDIKTTADLSDKYVKGVGFVPSWQLYEYDRQMAMYRLLFGEDFTCYLGIITKENIPQTAIVELKEDTLKFATEKLILDIDKVLMYRKGENLHRCGHCDYCKETGNSSVNYFYF